MVRRIVDGDLKVACPLCNAQPERPCKNLGQGGDLGEVVHRERRRAAEAAVAALVEQARQAVKEAGEPGVGMAWEIFPGRTPYTRGSELQNAETSAWGRAIIAVGASDSKRGIASREEVRNRQAERDDGLPTNADGSLSRSRTTDEQKAAAGVMTDAEQRAHNALAKPPPNTGRVERVRAENGIAQGIVDAAVDAAVDDRWTTDAPSWLVGVDPPEDQPGSILPAQRSQIMAVYTALGIKGRDERLRDLNEVLGTKDAFGVLLVSSTNDLSHQQAARLLENLHERHTGKMTRR